MYKYTTKLDERTGLEVELNTRHPHKTMPDGSFQRIEKHVVSLQFPSMPSSPNYPYPSRLLDLDLNTAINLHRWLTKYLDQLIEFAREEQES